MLLIKVPYIIHRWLELILKIVFSYQDNMHKSFPLLGQN